MPTTYTSIATAVILALAGTSSAQQTTAQKPEIDPEAIAALQRMGAFLRDQKSFTVHTKTETDYVLDSGQKVRLSSRGEIRARRPDHLRAETVSDRKDRQFFYDGKTFTIYAPRVGYYTTVAAPPTIRETADALQDRYGLELPLVDLFRWGQDPCDLSEITAATRIGTATIDGKLVDQYAFRQPGLDWQIWIQRGAQPVPRKIVLTTTDDPERPERAVELTWNLGARHADSEFAFAPPKNSHKIHIAELQAPVTTAQANPPADH